MHASSLSLLHDLDPHDLDGPSPTRPPSPGKTTLTARLPDADTTHAAREHGWKYAFGIATGELARRHAGRGPVGEDGGCSETEDDHGRRHCCGSRYDDARGDK